VTATTTRTFSEMTLDVYETNKANGWFDDQRAFGDDMALTHSEVSEMFEAFRDYGFDDVTKALCEKAGTEHTCKPEGFGSEAADVLVRVLDTCFRYEVILPWSSLEEVVSHPLFNADDTPGTHIYNLHLLLSRVAIFDMSFSATVSYLVAWCRHLDPHLDRDLQAEFDRKLAYNKTRGHKHGGKRI